MTHLVRRDVLCALHLQHSQLGREAVVLQLPALALRPVRHGHPLLVPEEGLDLLIQSGGLGLELVDLQARCRGVVSATITIAAAAAVDIVVDAVLHFIAQPT